MAFKDSFNLHGAEALFFTKMGWKVVKSTFYITEFFVKVTSWVVSQYIAFDNITLKLFQMKQDKHTMDPVKSDVSLQSEITFGRKWYLSKK